MSCEHPNTVITCADTVVCVSCGLERPILLNTPDYHTHIQTAPLARFYSRPDRWNTLLKKIVGIHSGPSIIDPIWAYLKSNKPFPTVSDLKQKLRKSKLDNKHYPSIHVFARCFCLDYINPRHDPQVVLKKLNMYFAFILKMHQRSTKPNKKIFSYNWLL